MQHVVFYSWQSDLESAITRVLIEEAVQRAILTLPKDENAAIEAVVDRDTWGVSGTPGIAETIFRKIDACDAFICDVSIVNAADSIPAGTLWKQISRVIGNFLIGRATVTPGRKRQTPNPNVLIELGYAAARIGWERIILIQNTAFGDQEKLPFDLRGRRILSFHLSQDSGNEARIHLRNQLEQELSGLLAGMLKTNFWVGKRKPRWFGFWELGEAGLRGGSLFIREVGASSFLFEISIFDGARTGHLRGLAQLTGPDTAFACLTSKLLDEPCEIKFRRSLGISREIRIETTQGCYIYAGMGATFDGTYTCDQDLLFDSGVADELDLQRLYTITGKYYRPYLERFQQVSESEKNDFSADSFPARVTIGGAKGLYTIYEAIFMKDEEGRLWLAYIDNDVVRYFTTERQFKAKLPPPIDAWRQRFADVPVAFDNEVDPIPKSIP